jgi:hypothetical protein
MATKKPTYGTNTKTVKAAWNFPWTKRQFVAIGVGLFVIIIGFALLSTGLGDNWDNPLAISVAPIVLVIGYCVIIPIGIMLYRGNDEQRS